MIAAQVKEEVKSGKVSMRTIFAALTKELGQSDGTSVFEWYCKTYNLTIADEANETIKREVLGL